MKKYSRVALFGMLGLAAFLVAWAASSTPAPTPSSTPQVEEGTVAKMPSDTVVHLENNQKIDEFRLDHYQVYAISHQPAPDMTIFLRGQFDKNQFLKANLSRYIRFLNPVQKNNEPMYNRHAHLNWYYLETDPEPVRKVSYYNQFGTQTIKIQNAVGLLVPTLKRESDAEFPDKLDHYKVYEVVSAEPVEIPVVLKDQFVSHENRAIVPRYFAVPVEKRHEDAYYQVVNKEDHLVFYALSLKEFQEYRPTWDQFGDHEMKTRYIEMLGVPTKKIAWSQ